LIEWCKCEVLINAGATLTADRDGWTPLHAAAASATPDCAVIRLLVDAVVRSGDSSLLEAKTKGRGNTALHLAASNDKAHSPRMYGLNTLMPSFIKRFIFYLILSVDFNWVLL